MKNFTYVNSELSFLMLNGLTDTIGTKEIWIDGVKIQNVSITEGFLFLV